MKKIFIVSFLSVFLFSSASAHVTTVVEVPSTFTMKVGEGAGVKNYQGMEIDFQSVKNDDDDCQKSSTTPCPLGSPANNVNARKEVVLYVTTPGGCGPGADSRCLGAPAFANTFTIKEGSSEDVLGLVISVSNIVDNSATFKLAVKADSDDDSSEDEDNKVIKPLPPVVKINSTTLTKGTVKEVDKIIICPNGESDDNCSVCSKGECKTETGPANPGKIGNAVKTTNAPVFELKNDETLVSAIKVETEESSGSYEVKAKRKARLLFLIPVNPEIIYFVNASGTASVAERPWWNFLAW